MDLRHIANTVIADALTIEPTRYTTPLMQEEFGINERQAQQVKKYAKQIGRDQGFMWGFDPEGGYFRIAPANAPHIAHRMKEYVLQHWMDAGNAASVVFEGAQRQGYATDEEVREVSQLSEVFRNGIESLSTDLGFDVIA